MGVGFLNFFNGVFINCLFWQRCLKAGYPSSASCLSVDSVHPIFSKKIALGNSKTQLNSATQSL